MLKSLIMMNVRTRCWLIALAFYTFMDADTPGFAAIVIGANESRDGSTILIDHSLTIENHGTVSGILNVCNGCDLYIENAGTFNATVSLESTSTLTQVMKRSDDITSLGNVGTNYGVWVKDTLTNILNLNDIVDKTNDAEKYKLENAKLSMNGAVSVNNVDIAGKVIIYTDITPDSDFTLFTNLSGTGTVNIVSSNLDSLYLMETYMVGGDMNVRVVRSTDYARVLKADTNIGMFLNQLRITSPDDPLIQQLDAARTIDDFNRVLDNSVRIHPIKMMQVLRTIYSHKTLETMYIAHDDGMGITPFYVFSKNISSVGIEPFLNLNLFDDLHIKISGNILNLKYSDDINSYSAMSYGLSADAVHDLPVNNFIRVYGGINLSSFDSGMVFDGNGAVQNPNGVSGYVVGELGHRFDFDNKYYISPFVMCGGDYATILNSKESNYYIGAGGDIGFNFEFDGFRYDYAMRGIVRSEGAVGTELKVSIWSLTDDAGAGVRGGILYEDMIGTSYHIALDARFNF